MIAVRFLIMFLIGVVTSFYLFPTALVAFPYQNTKNILAAIGCALFAINSARVASARLNKDMFVATVYASIFSLVCLFSVVYNRTPDYTYVTYFTSMWVWLAGAYTVCCAIKEFHGSLTLKILTNYLAGVCVFQCVIALLIDNYPGVSSFVDSIFLQPTDFFDGINRLYGIGAALDVAGIRFAVVLVLLSYQLISADAQAKKTELFFYIISFITITLIGNMIARTTIVGTSIGFLYMLYYTIFNKSENNSPVVVWKWFVLIILVAIPIGVYYYNINASFHSNMRFAFEGFFSLVEKGYWQTDSNDRLKSMAVWPDNWKTWIIGDGYFGNPAKIDPYVVANISGNFYMQTDVGYCRFIFYCGVIGLLAFSAFIINVTFSSMKRYPNVKMLFFLLLVLNFIIWVKVASDIYFIYALILCLERKEVVEDKFAGSVDENSILSI